MNDPLLDMDGRAQRERRIREAVHRAESITGFDRTTANLAPRCLEFVRKCKLVDSESTTPSAFLAHLGATSEVFAAAHDVRDGLRNGLDACLGCYEHEMRDVAALLLGRAASAALVEGLCAADPPADTLVPRLFQLCGVDSLTYDALTAALAGALSEDEQAGEAMFTYLGQCVDDINQHPGKFVYEQDSEPFARHVREWRASPSIVDLWRESAGQHFLPTFDRLNFVDVLLRVVPAETLEVLNRLRFPQPIDWILATNSIRYDCDRMIELVQSAPNSVDCDGKWNGSVLALLLLREADNYCQELWRAAHRNATASEEVEDLLHSWLTQVATVVVGRNDGKFLATQWLLMKSMDERLERNLVVENSFLFQLEMVGWIGGSLVEAGLRGRDLASTPRSNVEHSAEGSSLRGNNETASLDTLASKALLDRLGDDTVPDSQQLLSRLDILLLANRDRDFEVEATFDVGVTGFVDSSIGYLLAMEDCTDRWKRSWDLLAEQRRVVQHWRHTKDSNALAPSLFLVRAGLAALDWLCFESVDRREVAETLWRTMFDAVRECWLTISVTHLVQSIERDIGRFFCRHPTVFGASTAKPDSNRPYSELLADDLRTLGGDDALMARCCQQVSRNLQDQTHLHHALRSDSSQGHAVLRQFVRWQQLERRVKRRPQLRQAVEKILAEME